MAYSKEESLDTNVILRMMLGDVPEQGLRIVDLFMRQEVSYRVEDLAVMEAVYVMQGQERGRQEIVERLMVLMDDMNIKMNRALFERVFPMYLEHPKLSFNDCCLAGYVAMNEAEPLWTFDKELAKGADVATLL